MSERTMDLTFTNWAADRGVLQGARHAAVRTAELNKDWTMACYAFGIESSDIQQLHSSYKSLDVFPFNGRDLTHMGMHVARCVFANHVHKGTNEQFNKEGLIIIEDFDVSSTYINKLNETDVGISKKHYNMFQGQIPGLRELVEDCLGRSATPYLEQNTFYQVIENIEDDNDEQKDYHCDTFFPALKFWYFPDDVDVEQGPFVYVKNSPVLTYEKLDWLYEQTCAVVDGTWEKERRRGHPEGSFRVTETELFKMNLHACPVPVKAGTLVIGNVGGFHGRGSVSGSHTRRAIHGSVRVDNPFQ